MKMEKEHRPRASDSPQAELGTKYDPLTRFLSIVMSETVKVEVEVPKAVVEVVKGFIWPQSQIENLDNFWCDLIIKAVARDIEFLCGRIGNPTTKTIVEEYPGLKEALGTHCPPIIE